MINFKNFTALNNNEKEMIFKWRNDERVNGFFIKKNITKKEHFNFIKSLENDKTRLYFLLLLNGENNDKMGIFGVSQELILNTLQGLKEKPIGVINFIDISKNECEFGIYQNPDLMGFGCILLNELTRYAFKNLSVQRLNARAFNENLKAIKLFTNFGFSVINKDLKFTYFQMNNEYYLNKWGGI